MWLSVVADQMSVLPKVAGQSRRGRQAFFLECLDRWALLAGCQVPVKAMKTVSADGMAQLDRQLRAWLAAGSLLPPRQAGEGQWPGQQAPCTDACGGRD
jgi:hypothetical protein